MIEQLIAIDSRLIALRSQLLFARFLGHYNDEAFCERQITLLETYRAQVCAGVEATL